MEVEIGVEVEEDGVDELDRGEVTRRYEEGRKQ